MDDSVCPCSTAALNPDVPAARFSMDPPCGPLLLLRLPLLLPDRNPPTPLPPLAEPAGVMSA